MTSCLIIGAGLAGLTAAQSLQANGFEVTVLDKGRGVGGRMATRRFDGGRVDHGAQFFTVRSDAFRSYVNQWLEQGVAQEWSRGFPPHNNDDGHPRYCGAEGMTTIAKYLARGLAVHTHTEVSQIEQSERHWQATTAAGQTFTADSLIMTAPVPQSLTLLEAGQVLLPPQDQQALEAVTYNPCFAVLLTLNGESQIPEPGAVQIDGHPMRWIGDNKMKGISARTAVTIHASAEFTHAHFEAERTLVAQKLIDAAHEQGWFDKALVREVQVQRWRYAQPIIYYPERCLLIKEPLPLVFAGDAFQEAKVEGAVLSGLTAAQELALL
ncbi:MAG: FAD-dependent oxidoreductase [Anaerolineales bacterium]|nr:FAD-dependent oxidoreductase [Anaerolineales bacterium]